MPNYDFRCSKCKKRFSVYLSYAEYGKREVKCTFCKSSDVKRIINRVRFARTTESRLDDLANSPDLDGLEEDPRSLGKMMRQLSRETGEELGPEFDEVINRLEKGEDPSSIADSMPDLGDDID